MPEDTFLSNNDDQGSPPATEGVKLPSSYEVPETEFCVYGKVYAHPQHADALARVYEATTRLSAFEPGVIYYCICRESQPKSSGEGEEKDGERASGGSRVFHFFERYTGREAFQAHNRQPIIRKLLEEDKYIEKVEAVFAKPLA
ncbi:hypothetical protein QBC45DRAFT_59808 [Copromyces sp. CBS 386.78]|nr:hypothetical protein QBC45DRAFT_59808 [Copromyces sp. CBS 386.78]